MRQWFASGDKRGLIEIALGRWRGADADRLVGQLHVQSISVGLGVDRNRSDPQPARGGNDPAGDLPRLAMRILSNTKLTGGGWQRVMIVREI